MTPRASVFFGMRNLWSAEGAKRLSRMKGAIAGIALSLVPLVVVLEVADGMIEGITARYLEVGTFHLQIRTFADATPDETARVTREISSVSGVTGVYPVRSGLALAYSPSGRTGVTVRSLPADVYEKDAGFRRYLDVLSGSFDLATPGSVLLSRAVAQKLGLSVGDSMRLLTAKTIPNGGYVLRPSTFVVRGVFTTGYRELDALQIFIGEAEGARIFTDPGSEFIAVTVRDPYADLSSTTWNIKRHLSNNWYVYTWSEIEQPMLKTFDTTKNLLLFITVLIVVVASVNIASSLVMMVIEKTEEVAVLRALGAGPRGVSSIFITTGFVVGVVGAICGLALGLVAAVNVNELIAFIQDVVNAAVAAWSFLGSPFQTAAHRGHFTLLNDAYYLSTIPIRINWQEIGTIGVLTIVLATVASWFPARRAASIKPLEVLRRY